MKNPVKYALVTSALAGMFGLAALHAQVTKSAYADIPFAFTANGVQLPPGKYHVRETSTDKIWQLYRDANRHSIFLQQVQPIGGAAKSSKLVFRCHEGNCFLSELWYQGMPSGLALPQSRSEKELARSDHKSVIIAMR